MWNIGNALEMYLIDHGTYPLTPNGYSPASLKYGWGYEDLTTPIAYLINHEIIRDSFGPPITLHTDKKRYDEELPFSRIRMTTYAVLDASGNLFYEPWNLYPKKFWALFSCGPIWCNIPGSVILRSLNNSWICEEDRPHEEFYQTTNGLYSCGFFFHGGGPFDFCGLKGMSY